MSTPTAGQPTAPAAAAAQPAAQSPSNNSSSNSATTIDAQAAEAIAQEAEALAAEAEEGQESTDNNDDDESESSESEAPKLSKKEAKAEKDAIKELKKRLKLKVDGQEFEEEIDLNDDEALIKHLQKAKAFDKKAQESAMSKKQLEGLVEALKTNPADVLAQLGLNVDELAYNHLNKVLEDSKKSPEQLEYEKAIAERDALKKEKEELAKAREAAEIENLRNQAAATIQDEILTVLKASDGILSPEDPEVIADIARAMLRYTNANQKVDIKDVVKVVENRQLERLKRLSSKWDEATFTKIFGKQKMEELRKARLAKKKAVKTETARQIPSTGETKPPEPPKEVKKVAYKDFFSPYKK